MCGCVNTLIYEPITFRTCAAPAHTASVFAHLHAQHDFLRVEKLLFGSVPELEFELVFVKHVCIQVHVRHETVTHSEVWSDLVGHLHTVVVDDGCDAGRSSVHVDQHPVSLAVVPIRDASAVRGHERDSRMHVPPLVHRGRNLRSIEPGTSDCTREGNAVNDRIH